MSGKWYVWLPVVAIVTVALLVGGGYLIYRGAWESGYGAGQSADDEEATETWPWTHHGVGRAWRPFGLGGALCGVFLFILALSAIGHGVRLLAWRCMAPGFPGAMGGPWRRHWRRWPGPGHYGPWAPPGWRHPRCDEEQEAESAGPAEEE